MTALVARPQRARHAGFRQRTHALVQQRLMMLMLLFLAGLTVLVVRVGWFAISGPSNAEHTLAKGENGARRDIVDRNGEVLARTIDAWSIGIHPNRLLGDAATVSRQLAALMPERTADDYLKIIKSRVNFTYLRRRALPDLVAAVNALGEPAMAYAREPERLYPQITLGAHVVGFTDFDGHGVSGMERVLNDRLGDPDRQEAPIALSIDSRVQAAMESELNAAMVSHQALGATGIVLDVKTGEIMAMVSLPVFNPNKSGQAAPEARRNNVTQSVYELGSTFKPLTMAAALDNKVVTDLGKRYDATESLKVGRFEIKDDHPMGRWLNVPEALVHSSNVITARVADMLGRNRMEAMFRNLGFYEPPHIELRERGRPLTPAYWGRTTTMTTGYGHGIAVTPLHLASAYAALVNGGIWRPATLLKIDAANAPKGRRVFSEETSYKMRQMLRLIVIDGTGKKGGAEGYRVGGKTGTAEKPGIGGYSKTTNVSTFAAAFPMDAPRYVVIAMLDSPKGTAESFGLTTAAWTAAPVVSRVIARTGPMLGIYPELSKDIPLGDIAPLLWKPKGGQ